MAIFQSYLKIQKMSKDIFSPPSIWIISDAHKVGSHTQCLAVAKMFEGVSSSSPIFHKISARFPWSFLPPLCWIFPLNGITPKLCAPWPSILIASGRQSVAPAVKIRQLSGCFSVYILDPGVNLALFDVVIAPVHDQLKGKTVLSIQGALHSLTPEILKTEALDWKDFFSKFPGPRGGILIGGDNAHYSYTHKDMDRLIQGLIFLQNKKGGSFLITPSRRTRPDLLAYLTSKLPRPFYIWDGQGNNPYKAMLGACDYFVVTNDSISMMSEVCFTKKPVYCFQLPIKKKKFQDFTTLLKEGGYINPFPPTEETNLTAFSLDEYTRLQPLVLERYTRHCQKVGKI